MSVTIRFVEQVLDDGGGVVGDEVVEHFGSARAASVGLAENILEGDGYAGKRRGVALRDTFVGGTGFCKGIILVDGDIAVEAGFFSAMAARYALASSTAEICLDCNRTLACFNMYWVINLPSLKGFGRYC